MVCSETDPHGRNPFLLFQGDSVSVGQGVMVGPGSPASSESVGERAGAVVRVAVGAPGVASIGRVSAGMGVSVGRPRPAHQRTPSNAAVSTTLASARTTRQPISQRFFLESRLFALGGT